MRYKNWLYVIDCRKPFGHYGQYPAPVATLIAKIIADRTGRDFDTQDREMHRADMAWNKIHYNRLSWF